MAVTGVITSSIPCLYFEWKNIHFFSLSQRADRCYRSPSFIFCNESWYFELYTNGQRSESSIGWLSVYLCKEYNKQNICVNYSIGVKECGGTTRIAFDRFAVFRETILKDGIPKFLERSELHSDRDIILPSGYLTVFCSIQYERKLHRDSSCQTELSESTQPYKSTSKVQSLLCNMKELFLSEKNCDITMQVKEKEFHVHKIILGARSQVFSAMFEHNMKENRNGVVEITDAEPDVFRDILLYMYCGEVEKLCPNNVFEYYKIADKYALNELKEECSKLMENSLSVSNACDVFLLSDTCNELNLKEQAKSFIIKNAHEVLSSDSWKSFSKENQSLSIQILESVVFSSVSLKK